MEVNPKQAVESLRAIEQAKGVVSRHSENSGMIQLVWGVVVLLGMIGFDVFPRLVAWLFGLKVSAGMGPVAAALFLVLLAAGTSLWTIWYRSHRPVKPLKIENKALFILWGFYHSAVIFLGTLFGVFLSRPPFWFTLVGVLSAAPLLIIGWRMRQRAYTQEG